MSRRVTVNSLCFINKKMPEWNSLDKSIGKNIKKRNRNDSLFVLLLPFSKNNAMLTLLLTLCYLFGIPLALMLLAKRWPIIEKISPMVVLYVIGLMVGNTDVLGAEAQPVCANVSNVVVLLTIPPHAAGF